MAGAPIETDALVIGAGPVGLWQVFQLGLQDIRCHVIDALPRGGGQPAELYPDKPIYDIPGLPVCSGQELMDRLQQQVRPFSPTLHLGQTVAALNRRDDGRFDVLTSADTAFVARSVFIAAGVGAFQARPLKLVGIEAFEGSQVFHRPQDAAAFAGRHVVVHGGEEMAVDWALRLIDADTPPASVTLLHRRDVFQADEADLARLQALTEQGRLRRCIGQPIGLQVSEGRLTGIQVVTPEDETRVQPLDTLLVCLGLSPRLGPIADWGLAMERKQLVVDTAHFETSVPGIHAVGDINTYPGKKKLILCGFHEATLAAFAAAARLFPEQRTLLQYTTTSPKLHRLLGVGG